MTVASPTSRDLQVEVVFNIRELGGYELPDGRTTAQGALLRSGALTRLTPAGMEILQAARVTTVIDFRSSHEVGEQPTPALDAIGAKIVHAPVFEQDASPTGLANEFPGYAVVYQRLLELGANAYRTLFETISTSDGTVLFHCAVGKDRTGVGAALILDLLGAGDDTVVADYARSVRLLEPAFKEWLPRIQERGINEEQARALMDSPPADMIATLTYIRERWGSSEGYLREIGLSETTLTAVRSRLVD